MIDAWNRMAKEPGREWTERERMAMFAALLYCFTIVFVLVATYYFACNTMQSLVYGVFAAIMALFFFVLATSLIADTLTKTSISFEDKGLWLIKVLGKRTTRQFIPYDEILAAILGPQTLTIEYRPEGKKGLKHKSLVDEEVTESLLLELSKRGIMLELD
jgi:ABC-type transport system involved in multi-copper enzyme maturation permease subunit